VDYRDFLLVVNALLKDGKLKNDNGHFTINKTVYEDMIMRKDTELQSTMMGNSQSTVVSKKN